ncbi:membrane protein CcdC involved in cytochrome C biogenesis [Scopulibacillus daqui]|uniref:Membrane protein CcdC involved in cytochrome C biogenesis n=1 Tax=Scopulibacillus daqui TaxID=1469162 RepID=A0ABS2PWR3_9BACL|nr:cytochrome c biogenesis protein CcdC [Scopulibacillus daqui]MBM7644484.1 membrane protein CcdC involved in cytochrome C biogenesis [Scopulibacillus daqui]
MLVQILSLLIGVVFAFSIIAVRLKASKKPTNTKKILLPPVFMSTGALMFIFQPFRVPFTEALEAFLVGAFFSIFLIKTSKFEMHDNQVYLKRSKAFIFILIGLLVIRTVMKIFLEKTIDVPQTGGLFFILAYGMIIPWRVAMFVMYKRLLKKHSSNDEIVTPT